MDNYSNNCKKIEKNILNDEVQAFKHILQYGDDPDS